MATKTTSLKASTKVVAEKTVLEKKNDAIVTAQVNAIAVAVKTADDAEQFFKNPATFAKKNGIELTASFSKELKDSVANLTLSDSLKASLSDASVQKMEKIFAAYDPERDDDWCGTKRVPLKRLTKVQPVKLDVKIIKCGPVKVNPIK